jgi:hypothetical protein
MIYRESLHEVENKLRSEQIARRIADQNVAELDKEKAIMKAELKELIERRSQDVSIINKVSLTQKTIINIDGCLATPT